MHYSIFMNEEVTYIYNGKAMTGPMSELVIGIQYGILQKEHLCEGELIEMFFHIDTRSRTYVE